MTRDDGYSPGEVVTYFCRIHPSMRGAFEVTRVINWKRNGPSLTSSPNRHSWPDLSEDLPVDVLPCSNDEYFPPPPTPRAARDHAARRRARCERWRRKFGMSRREFVRTAAATAIGFWAIDMVRPGLFGNYGWAHNTATTAACDLEWDGRRGLATLRNLPGEFIFDVQSHHVDPDGMWRVTNPALHAFFAAVWPQASGPRAAAASSTRSRTSPASTTSRSSSSTRRRR